MTEKVSPQAIISLFIPSRRKILKLLLSHGALSYRDISEELGIDEHIVLHHCREMESQGLITSYMSKIYPDENRVYLCYQVDTDCLVNCMTAFIKVFVELLKACL